MGKQGCLGGDKLNYELDSLVSCREYMGMYRCAYTVDLCLCFGLLLAQTELQSFRSRLMSGFMYMCFDLVSFFRWDVWQTLALSLCSDFGVSALQLGCI